MKPASDTAEIGQWIFDRLNDHDVEALREVWSDETIDHFPHGVVKGTEALVEFFSSMVAAMPDIHWHVRQLVAEGDAMFARWQITGTFDGSPFMGFKPTGTKITLDGMDNFVFEDGRIKLAHIVYDQLSFVRQLGALPNEGTLLDRLSRSSFNVLTSIKRLFSR